MGKNKDVEIFEEIPKIYDGELRKWSREYGPSSRPPATRHGLSLYAGRADR